MGMDGIFDARQLRGLLGNRQASPTRMLQGSRAKRSSGISPMRARLSPDRRWDADHPGQFRHDQSRSSHSVRQQQTRDEAMATSDKHDDLDALREEMAKLKADIATVLKDLHGLGLASAGAARRAAATEGERLGADIEETVAELKRRGEQTLRDTKSVVAEQPILSVLIALIVGIVLGRLLGRR